MPGVEGGCRLFAASSNGKNAMTVVRSRNVSLENERKVLLRDRPEFLSDLFEVVGVSGPGD